MREAPATVGQNEFRRDGAATFYFSAVAGAEGWPGIA
jgi:hypothetical protein